MHLIHPVSIAIVFAIASFARPVLADDLKVVQLEQDVRDLKQQVQQQSRRIDALEQELRQARANTSGAAKSNIGNEASRSADPSRTWLNIANWDRVRTGTTELDVIAALGPPTAVRKPGGAQQTLLYSLEIAAGGFLVGEVVLSDHRVIEVRKPVLQ
jgi:hypothetical protein